MNPILKYSIVLLLTLAYYLIVISNPNFIGVYILLVGMGVIMYVDAYFSMRFVQFKRLQKTKTDEFNKISDTLMKRQDHEWETNPLVSNRIKQKGILHGFIRVRFIEFIGMSFSVLMMITLGGLNPSTLGLLTVIIAFYGGYIYRQSTGIHDILSDYKELFDKD